MDLWHCRAPKKECLRGTQWPTFLVSCHAATAHPGSRVLAKNNTHSRRHSHFRSLPLRRVPSLLWYHNPSQSSTLDPTECFPCWGRRRAKYREKATHSGVNVRGTILMVRQFNPSDDAKTLRESIDGTGKEIVLFRIASSFSAYNIHLCVWEHSQNKFTSILWITGLFSSNILIVSWATKILLCYYQCSFSAKSHWILNMRWR